jgi:5-methylcytosine-specific restriction endonuclease McrA
VRIPRTCSVCGTPHRNRGGRCDAHKIPLRSGTYSRNAALVRATATICHLCGEPFTDPNDPPVADHVIPRGIGGSDDLSNLRASHRSCNGRKGQSLGNDGGLYTGAGHRRMHY